MRQLLNAKNVVTLDAIRLQPPKAPKVVMRRDKAPRLVLVLVVKRAMPLVHIDHYRKP